MTPLPVDHPKLVFNALAAGVRSRGRALTVAEVAERARLPVPTVINALRQLKRERLVREWIGVPGSSWEPVS